MRKLAIIMGAATALGLTWAAVAGQNDVDSRPQANAYMSLDFGHPSPATATRAPFHYGLRMSYDNRIRASNGGELPALAAFDFDNRGNRLASLSGVPFAGRIAPPLRQNDGEASAPDAPGGFTFFDLSLMVVGAAGVGYLIYKVADNKESDDPEPETTGGGLLGGLLGGNTGGLLGGLLGGSTGGTTGGGLLGGDTGGLLGGSTGGLLGGLLGGATGGATGFAGADGRTAAERDVERLRWLDGGTGQMGDLQKH